MGELPARHFMGVSRALLISRDLFPRKRALLSVFDLRYDPLPTPFLSLFRISSLVPPLLFPPCPWETRHEGKKFPLTPAKPTAFNTLLFSCAVKASYVFLSALPIVPGSGCRGGGLLDRAAAGARLGGIVGLCLWV